MRTEIKIDINRIFLSKITYLFVEAFYRLVWWLKVSIWGSRFNFIGKHFNCFIFSIPTSKRGEFFNSLRFLFKTFYGKNYGYSALR